MMCFVLNLLYSLFGGRTTIIAIILAICGLGCEEATFHSESTGQYYHCVNVEVEKPGYNPDQDWQKVQALCQRRHK